MVEIDIEEERWDKMPITIPTLSGFDLECSREGTEGFEAGRSKNKTF